MEYAPAELLIRDWLNTRFAPARVVTETPADLASVLPCIQVSVFGGGDDVAGIDDTNFDIDYFAADRTTARAGAESVRGALRFELPGQQLDTAFVLELLTISKPSYVPYDNPNLRRFVASYRIRLHHTL